MLQSMNVSLTGNGVSSKTRVDLKIATIVFTMHYKYNIHIALCL